MLAELEHDVSVSTSNDTPESEGGWAVLGLTCVFIFFASFYFACGRRARALRSFL